MRNAQGVRKLIPISHLMAYFLRLCDTGGAIEDDSGFDQNEVVQMNWYTIDELEEEEQVEILSKWNTKSWSHVDTRIFIVGSIDLQTNLASLGLSQWAFLFCQDSWDCMTRLWLSGKWAKWAFKNRLLKAAGFYTHNYFCSLCSLAHFSFLLKNIFMADWSCFFDGFRIIENSDVMVNTSGVYFIQRP